MQLIGIPSLIAGIVLMTAGSHWFHGAATVGAILTVASGLVIVLGFILFIVAIVAVGSSSSAKRRRF